MNLQGALRGLKFTVDHNTGRITHGSQHWAKLMQNWADFGRAGILAQVDFHQLATERHIANPKDTHTKPQVVLKAK